MEDGIEKKKNQPGIRASTSPLLFSQVFFFFPQLSHSPNSPPLVSYASHPIFPPLLQKPTASRPRFGRKKKCRLANIGHFNVLQRVIALQFDADF